MKRKKKGYHRSLHFNLYTKRAKLFCQADDSNSSRRSWSCNAHHISHHISEPAQKNTKNAQSKTHCARRSHRGRRRPARPVGTRPGGTHFAARRDHQCARQPAARWRCVSSTIITYMTCLSTSKAFRCIMILDTGQLLTSQGQASRTSTWLPSNGSPASPTPTSKASASAPNQ